MSDAVPGRIASDELYGLVAEFEDDTDLLDAANAVRKAGYTKTDAYTPFAVTGLDEALGMEPTRLGWIVLLAGISGVLLGFGMQWWSNSVFYPLNIGGKPLNSWPNFVVITFEITVLLSSFTAGLFMIGRNGLPRLYHPVFNTPGFERATRDKFFLCVEASDPKFDLDEVRSLLEQFDPDQISEVER